MTKSAIVLKKSGRKQRADTALTKDIATALTRKVLMGEPLHPHRGHPAIILTIGEGEQESVIQLPVRRLMDWITRRNVIPETGNTLRDVLDKARQEYRVGKQKEMDEMRLDVIDRKFNRVISMRTKVPLMGMFGPVVDKETGKPMLREDPRLLKIQMDNVQFLAERLNSARYGKVEKVEGKHLVFSLDDLRRAEEARDKADIE